MSRIVGPWKVIEEDFSEGCDHSEGDISQTMKAESLGLIWFISKYT